MKNISIADRLIGDEFPTFIVAEIGINHGGDLKVAKEMVASARRGGAEVIKHQTHIIEDEMAPAAKEIVPANANVSIYDVIENCRLSLDEEVKLKTYTEELGMIYLSTPFSRSAADFLMEIGVPAFKIGSGECNNYPLVEHISSYGLPVILSTGMNDLTTITPAVRIIEKHEIPYALLHCVNVYPAPASTLRLGAIDDLRNNFSNAQIGFSDHSVGNYASFAAVGLGANIIERHYTDHFDRSGPDIACSIDETGLKDLLAGCEVVRQARGGRKEKIPEEKTTERFAYATVVAIQSISKGEMFSKANVWVKRPGTGGIPAAKYWDILGATATRNIQQGDQLFEQDYA
jgi:N-acetylneuraminate synthase